MNAYRWDQLHVGLRHEFTAIVTRAMLDRFRADTGDVNPLHQDAAFAATRGHADVVVFGMLTASFYSTLVGVHLPGRNALLHSVDVAFLKPVLPDDTLTISGEITYLNDAFQQAEIAGAIRNQHGVKVSRATIKAGVRE